MSNLSKKLHQKNWQKGFIKITKHLLINYLIVATVFFGGGLFYLFNPFGAKEAEAAWFDENWGYRQRVDITNAGTAQTNYQVQITIGTSTLITAAKMQSDCDDIRVVDLTGTIYTHWLESGEHGCNQTSTYLWTKLPSIPTTGNTLYIYYGNANATNIQNGSSVFEFFDDFSGGFVDTTKWTGDTGNFTIVSGQLNLTSNSYRLNSATSFTGDYKVLTKTDTAATATNGSASIGFFASTSNNVGAHYQNSYWQVGNSIYGNLGNFIDPTQVIRQTVKVAGTAVTLAWDGEGADGGSSSYSVTGGISGETVSVGKRYDDALTGQAMNMSWDYIAVMKTASTEPSAASPTNEENSPQPVAYWRFDDGTGTNANDSTVNNQDGTLTNAVWKTEDQCIAGKCLGFDGNGDYVQMADSNYLDIGQSASATISMWYYSTVTDTNAHMLIAKRSAETSAGTDYSIFSESNTLIWGTGTSADSCAWLAITEPSRNAWHHIVAVISSTGAQTGTKQFYVDGQLKGSCSYTNKAAANSNPAYFGRGFNAGVYWNGKIDEPKIYNYARSAAQVLADYNARGNSEGVALQAGIPQGNNPGALANGLVGYWKMDESAANSCTGGANDNCDASGNGNDGAWNGNATSGAGKFGHGVALDGSGDFVRKTSPANLPTGAAARTVAAWVNFSSTGTKQAVVQFGNNSNTRQTFLLDIATSGAFEVATWADDITSSTIASTGRWYHLAATYDGNTTLKLYINGTLDTTKTLGATLNTTLNASGLNFGGWDGGAGDTNFLNGKIDEARIYNRALSNTEVSQLYNWAPGPVGYWNMEEGTGTTANDTSGNGLTGTWNGTGSHWGTGKEGKAGTFNGTDDYINIASPTTLAFAAPGTVSGWVKTNSDTCQTFYSISDSDNANDTTWAIYAGNGCTGSLTNELITVARLDLGTGTYTLGYTTATRTELIDNRWHHISVTADGSAVRIYLDGQAKTVTVGGGSNNGTFTNLTGVDNASIGSQIYDNTPRATFFNGSIDQVRIYNYARSAAQVAWDYNRGGPVGAWRMDECQGTSLKDDSGNSYTGTLTIGATGSEDTVGTCSTSSTAWFNGVTGKRNYSVDLDGTDDYVQVTDTANLRFDEATKDFSLFAWVKRGANGEMNVISKEDADNDGYRLQFTSGNVVRCSVDAIDVDSSLTITDTNWHHIGCTIDRDGNGQVYLDGQANGTATAISSEVMANTSNIRLGTRSYTSANYLDGQIDDVKVFNYALTLTQVKTLYDGGAVNYGPATGAP